MRTKGAQPGNQNAAKEGRKRIKVEISLSDERLARFERYLQAISGDDTPLTDAEIADAARHELYEWLDKLVEQV